MDQDSFERGLVVGLNTAVVVLLDHPECVHLVPTIEGYVAEVREAGAVRRNGGRPVNVVGVEGDLFMARPLAHPGDIGLEASPAEQMRVDLSWMVWRPGNTPTSACIKED